MLKQDSPCANNLRNLSITFVRLLPDTDMYYVEIQTSYSIDADTSSVKTIDGVQGVPLKWCKTGCRSDGSGVMLNLSKSK
jgi:hypothetical protein